MNYLNAENYQHYNENLSTKFSQDFNFQFKVRAYENPMFASYDLCMGLLQFLSHRPKVGIVRFGSSVQEHLLPQFYRLQTPLVFKKENESFIQFVSQFDHEMNFVLWSSENEITGEVIYTFDQRLEIHKKLTEKRIFSIEIKSESTKHDVEILKQAAYSVIIQTGTIFSKMPCLVFHSDKLKSPSILGHFQSNFSSTNNVFENSIKTDEATTQIRQFDSNVLNYFNKFASKPTTSEDRLVIFSRTVAGSALRAELNLSTHQAFAPSDLPSWVIESFSNWWPEAKSTELMMGLLVIDHKVLTAENIKKILFIHEQIAQKSTWSTS